MEMYLHDAMRLSRVSPLLDRNENFHDRNRVTSGYRSIFMEPRRKI